MANIIPFEENIDRYEQWFVDNRFVFLSEVGAIKKMLPIEGRVVEVGVGSGLFAEKLGIKEGCDPSPQMRKKAFKRGVNVINGVAESLPYGSQSVDCILMVTTICFVDDIQKTFQEAQRVIKPNGTLILAFVDRNSSLGKKYINKKETSLFYKNANFYSVSMIQRLLAENGFVEESVCQTLFNNLKDIKDVQQTKQGYGKGSFIVIKSYK